MPQPWELYSQSNTIPQAAKIQPWEQYQSAQPTLVSQPKKPDLLDRFNQPLSDIGEETAQILKANQNPASTALQLGGQGAKLAALPIIMATKEVVAPALAPAAHATANAIGDTSAGQWVGDKLMQARDAIVGFDQAHPELSSNIGAAINIAGTGIGGKYVATPITKKTGQTISAIEAASQKAPSILGDVKSGVSANAALGNVPKLAHDTIQAPLNMLKVGVTGADDLGKAATQWYKTAEDMGGAIKPQGTNQIIANITKKVTSSTPEAQAFGLNSVVDKTLSDLKNLTNKSLTLRGIDEIDGILQDRISTAMRAGDKEAIRGLKTIQNEFRDASNTVTPKQLINPKAFEAWRNGDALYSAKIKSQQIENIVKNAYNEKVPSTGIQTGFRQLAKSIDKYGSQGWTAEEISAIREAAKTGLVTGALKTLGSRLMSGIAGTAAGATGGGVIGAPIGLVVGEAAGYPLRSAANQLQKSKAVQVQRLVGNRDNIKAIMQMPPAQAKAELQKLKPRP